MNVAKCWSWKVLYTRRRVERFSLFDSNKKSYFHVAAQPSFGCMYLFVVMPHQEIAVGDSSGGGFSFVVGAAVS